MTPLDTPFPAYTFTMASEGVRQAAKEFPGADDPRWQVFAGEHEPEKRQAGPEAWGPATTALIVELMSPAWCKLVSESCCGGRPLVADVYGGGMHMSLPGARLDTHADFNRHPHTAWRRSANLLLFLTPDWQPEWGGVLELGKGAAHVIPEQGRLVMFATGPDTWHGHPRPIVEGAPPRKSLAVYYYSWGEAVTDSDFHDTRWAGKVGT